MHHHHHVLLEGFYDTREGRRTKSTTPSSPADPFLCLPQFWCMETGATFRDDQQRHQKDNRRLDLHCPRLLVVDRATGVGSGRLLVQFVSFLLSLDRDSLALSMERDSTLFLHAFVRLLSVLLIFSGHLFWLSTKL